jgi:hypothetical protein
VLQCTQRSDAGADAAVLIMHLSCLCTYVQNLNQPLADLEKQLTPRPNNNDLSTMSVVQVRDVDDSAQVLELPVIHLSYHSALSD